MSLQDNRITLCQKKNQTCVSSLGHVDESHDAFRVFQ